MPIAHVSLKRAAIKARATRTPAIKSIARAALSSRLLTRMCRSLAKLINRKRARFKMRNHLARKPCPLIVGTTLTMLISTLALCKTPCALLDSEQQSWGAGIKSGRASGQTNERAICIAKLSSTCVLVRHRSELSLV